MATQSRQLEVIPTRVTNNQYNRIDAHLYYRRLYNDAKDRYLADIIDPHPLTQFEIEDIREETVELIRRIRVLEFIAELFREQRSERLDQVEHDLFLTRVEYRLRLSRTFRINDLPVEVLDNIFRLATWTAPDAKSSINSRLWLTWVCRLWRGIVIQDPMIWNTIWFRDGPHFECSLEWFRRARSTPLDIRISDCLDFTLTCGVMEDILDKVFTKIHQIRILLIITENEMVAQIASEKMRAFAKREGPMMLERIELHNVGLDPALAPMPFVGGAILPTLKHVAVSSVIYNWDKSYLTNLTTLDLRRILSSCWPSFHKLRVILGSSPNLWRLCLDGVGPRCELDEVEEVEPISLPNLKILVYGNFKLPFALFVPGLISAPNVRHLTLSGFMRDDYTPLFELLTGHFPHIEFLSLHAIEVKPTFSMVRWLVSMPKIRVLRVINIQPYFLSFFLPALTQTGQQPEGPEHAFVVPAVCPCLTTLDLQSIDPDSVIRWIDGRMGSGYPIEKIYISMELSQKMTEAQHTKLLEFAPLFRLGPGTRSMEEDCILNQLKMELEN
ncbi:hypothetical protein AX15_000625 [Amanita polypyramis BW_CC]|nr:hypothetical protein AX15_000625 [Amanita polypyramis BW_CC]